MIKNPDILLTAGRPLLQGQEAIGYIYINFILKTTINLFTYQKKKNRFSSQKHTRILVKLIVSSLHSEFIIGNVGMKQILNHIIYYSNMLERIIFTQFYCSCYYIIVYKHRGILLEARKSLKHILY